MYICWKDKRKKMRIFGVDENLLYLQTRVSTEILSTSKSKHVSAKKINFHPHQVYIFLLFIFSRYLFESFHFLNHLHIYILKMTEKDFMFRSLFNVYFWRARRRYWLCRQFKNCPKDSVSDVWVRVLSTIFRHFRGYRCSCVLKY